MMSSNGNIFHVTGICAGNSPVTGEFPTQNQWRGALMFSLICAYMNGWVNNGEAGDLRCHRAHYDVTVMCFLLFFQCSELLSTKWMKSGLSITWINKCHWSILWNNMFWIMQWMSLLLISQLDKPGFFWQPLIKYMWTLRLLSIVIDCVIYTDIYLFSCTLLEIKLLLINS